MRPLHTLILWLALLWPALTPAQNPDLQRGQLGLPALLPSAPRFEVEYIAPELHKWYVPRHLVESYVRPWYVSDTNYARQFYSRYIDQLLEGDEFYDVLGSPVGRGWLVYSWTHQQPLARGSDIVKWPSRAVRNTAEARRNNTLSGDASLYVYDRFFDKLVIASDSDGRGNYRLMVGDEIFTLFTPLTFYKPNFNGVRLDYATDRLSSSLILSRPSDPDGLLVIEGMAPRPGAGDQTNVTHMRSPDTTLICQFPFKKKDGTIIDITGYR